MAQMVADHRGDKEIAVIITFPPVDGDFLADCGTSLFQEMRMKLVVEEVVGESLVNEDFGAG